MKLNNIILLLFYFCAYTKVSAQLSTHERPISFDTKQKPTMLSKSLNPVVIMPLLDMAKIEAEDKEDEEYDMPPRFGYQHKVNYDLKNSGTWFELSNGDKLWQLEVVCPAALSVNFCYDKFWIPDGGKFFVYSKDKKHSIGAFTSNNNKGDRENIRGFATGLVYGDDVVLEYYQPKEVTTDAIISIEYVVHGYRYIRFGNTGFGYAGSCMVNINCEEGLDWQTEKKAVALIIVNGERWCTGSLINTTDLSQKPYLLTADHCLGGRANEDKKYDADTLPNLDRYSFWWNYEVPGCDNINVEPDNYQVTTGATVLANNSLSDFALLQLTEDPKDIVGYTPYYLGWDCSGSSGDPGVCIHHPRGDVKKISTVAATPVPTIYRSYTEYTYFSTHWRVAWKSTQNGHGTTEGGSSGSPLLTAGHKVIGQLHGGYSDCGDSICAPDWYGKLNVSWTGALIGYNNSTYRRLNCWLDSLNTGMQTMEGLLVIRSDSTINANQQLYSNIRITNTGQLCVQGNVELMGNSRVIVESGGILIINGGTLSNADLVLKAGASLRLINGGVIVTQNGFKAPVGATIDIINGQIL